MFSPIKNLYTIAQVRELDHLATNVFGIAGFDLMQRAGNAVFAAIKQYWSAQSIYSKKSGFPAGRTRREDAECTLSVHEQSERAYNNAGSQISKSIVIFCGKGNNAGDGYVVAKLAKQAGIKVKVYYLCEPEQLIGDALLAANAAKTAGVAMEFFSGRQIMADLIVDALLGTGLQGHLQKKYEQAIAFINNTKLPVIAVDLPSGLNADSGTISSAVIKASITVTFIGAKRGLFTNQALEYTGKVLFADLDVPIELYTKVPTDIELLGDKILKLPPRQRTAHKGSNGHALVIGGDYGMPGAVRMAGEAAARVGAGLVTVATRPEHLGIIEERPELMCFGITSAEELLPLIDRATVLVIGPGLGKSTWSENLWKTAIKSLKPKIIDADGLNWLARFSQKGEWILTPHPGEAANLLGCSIVEVQQDRFSSINRIQMQYGGACIMKGAGSLALGTDGKIGVCPYGNPGMASGGMGDVLSGVLGGLLAQGLSLNKAAFLGMVLHAKAGDLAAENGERGLLASDLLPYFRRLVN